MRQRELLICLLFSGVALPVSAHHSFSMFDDKQELVLKHGARDTTARI